MFAIKSQLALTISTVWRQLAQYATCNIALILAISPHFTSRTWQPETFSSRGTHSQTETQRGDHLHWSLLPLRARCFYWMVYTGSTWEHWLYYLGICVCSKRYSFHYSLAVLFLECPWSYYLHFLLYSVLSFCSSTLLVWCELVL